MLIALALLVLAPQQNSAAETQTIPAPQAERPGLGQPVAGLHPHWRLEPIDLGERPLRVHEMACMEGGHLLLLASDPDIELAEGWTSLYRLDPEAGETHNIAPDVKLARGLCSVGTSIFAVSGDSMVRLNDFDADGIWETKAAVGGGWGSPVGLGAHEAFRLPLANGLVFQDGRLLTRLTDIVPNVPLREGQNSGGPLRNTIFSVDPTSGVGVAWMAGLHSPAGLAVVRHQHLLALDTLGPQGHARALYEVIEGRFVGHHLRTTRWNVAGNSKTVTAPPTIYCDRPKQTPVLYLPGEVAPTPQTILWVADPQHHSLTLIGDLRDGSIYRVEFEEVSGELQGVLLRHSRGLPDHVQSIVMAPDGSLYMISRGFVNGAVVSSGLHSLKINARGFQPFEIQSVKVTHRGFTVKFTKALDPAWLEDPTGVRVQSWVYSPNGEKQDLREHAITVFDLEFGLSPETVFLAVQDLEPGRVYHIQCDAKSPWSDSLWSGEAWYTINRIPSAVDLPNIGLGALPPAEATPLIGTSASTLMDYQGRKGDLPVYEQADFVNGPGYLEVGHGSGNLVSRTTHGDAHVHVEWYCPPGGEGDTRSNSGVYLHGRYEVQVFGTPAGAEPRVGGAGAIYGQHAPSRNLSTGPGTWQAYDIFFSAPRFEDGEKVRDARISMFWNGVRVHGEAVVSKPTGGSQGEEAPTGPLLLQDYRDGAEGPVRFRNVWIRDWKAPKWQPGEWQTPFDDASSWMVSGGEAQFELKDGVLRGTTRPNTPNTFFTSRQEYDDFELLFEARVHPELNSGVQIRSELVGDPGERGAPLRGYQVEIDPSPRSWTAGLYEERGRGWLHPLNTQPYAREAFRPGQWNQFRVLAEGPRIRTWLNGIPVADVYDAERTTGHLGFQVHGVGQRTDPLEVVWRNLRIRELSKSSK